MTAGNPPESVSRTADIASIQQTHHRGTCEGETTTPAYMAYEWCWDKSVLVNTERQTDEMNTNVGGARQLLVKLYEMLHSRHVVPVPADRPLFTARSWSPLLKWSRPPSRYASGESTSIRLNTLLQPIPTNSNNHQTDRSSKHMYIYIYI